MPRSSPSHSASMTTDFLILGGGVAGLRAALSLAGAGQVILLNKGTGRQGSSIYAQGGIAVAMDGPEGEKAHSRDTLKAGAGLCRREAVEILTQEGPARVRELIAWGARFDRKGQNYLLAREASHSRPRILRAKGDRTGEEIVRTLFARLRQISSIRWLDRHFSLDLMVHDGVCLGAVSLNERTGEMIPVYARATILATGGAGSIYRRTTNPSTATGDGLAMAFRAGAVMEDMEFFQFHPTALSLPNAPPFLITEALRGEGALLTNHKGEPFMARYHPDADLAPRDIVARAIRSEMDRERASHVFLDTPRLDPEFVKKRFPTIYQSCQSYGIDITREAIPVSPAAHFLIGGVKTDLRGATSLTGLYAVGEVACTQVHGANRLGSNSLLEGLVFGARAGAAAARHARKRSRLVPRPPLGRGLNRVLLSAPPRHWAEIQEALRERMWDDAGLIRSGPSLRRAIRQANDLLDKISKPPPSREAAETANMGTCAMLVAWAAWKRTESVGTHFRLDEPKGRKKPGRRHRAFSLKDVKDYGRSPSRRP